MAPPAALAPRFSIGRTLSLSFAALWRNLWRMSAVALSVTALHIAIEFYAPAASIGLPGIGVALLVFAVVTAPLVVAVLQHLHGGRPTFAGILHGGLRRIVRVFIGTAILLFVAIVPSSGLVTLAALLGLPEILLAVPIGVATIYVLAILAMWFVVVPVLVAEQVGILSSFRRSRHLTRGHRWAVLALALVLSVMVVALAMIATTVRLSLVVNAPMQMMLYPWLSLTLVPFSAFASLMTAIIPAVTYHLLQAEKEGGGSDVLARIFD